MLKRSYENTDQIPEMDKLQYTIAEEIEQNYEAKNFEGAFQFPKTLQDVFDENLDNLSQISLVRV